MRRDLIRDIGLVLLENFLKALIRHHSTEQEEEEAHMQCHVIILSPFQSTSNSVVQRWFWYRRTAKAEEGTDAKPEWIDYSLWP